MQQLMQRLTQSTLTLEHIENFQREAEDEFYLLNLADNTKLSESQGGSVYKLVQEVANVQGLRVPSVFLDTNPQINAFAFGGTNPAIVVTSALVDAFPERLLRAVIAHELGHIICKHTFYRLLAEHFDQFSKLVAFIPFIGSLLAMGIQLPLLDWYRKSELSADRAALLGTQDIEAVEQCILQLAGGSSRLAPELRNAEFEAQAAEFKEKYESF